MQSMEEGADDSAGHEKSPLIKELPLNPWFVDDNQRQQYITYQKQYFDLLNQIPNILVMFVHVATHDNYQRTGTDSEARFLFTAGWILATVAVSIFFLYITAQIALARGWCNGVERRQKLFRYIVHDMLWGRIEDATLISGIISNAMLLIGRVLAGQCSPNISIWDAQSCNPFADAHGVPTDQVLIVYGYCLVCQLLFKGITVEALVVNWVIAVGAVVFALAYCGAGIQLYVAIYSVLFITFSFEFERRMRISFLQAQIIKDAEQRKLDLLLAQQQLDHEISNKKNLERDHKLQLLNIQADNEKKLVETEKFQLRSLMGNVAHDLKTPLHAFAGDLDVLRDDIRKALGDLNADESRLDPFHKLLDSMDATCRFMAMAINRSQDYMKATSNIALVPSNGTLNLPEVVRVAVEYIRRVQSDRNIIVHPIPQQICPHTISDAHWLTENLMCLISNATKYSDKGATIDVRIILNSDVEAGKPMLHFSVEDTGIGLSEEARANLFQPFKQAQRLAGGTGLGLYSLSKRIEALGGSCGVGSRKDGKQGSMFWFKIPYRPDHTVNPDSIQKHINEEKNMAVYGNQMTTDIYEGVEMLKSILVVDDSPSILKVSERLLRRNGHEVETAENGSQALEILRKDVNNGVKRFDLVLTDLQMPVMDGLEFVRRFREVESSGESQERHLIVGMSANSDTQSSQNALDVGMDYFISKPFKYAELKAVLAHYHYPNTGSMRLRCSTTTDM